MQVLRCCRIISSAISSAERSLIAFCCSNGNCCIFSLKVLPIFNLSFPLLLLNSERYEQAIAAYDKAIALKPNFALAWHSKGYVLGELQRYEEAIASYDKAIALKPDDANIWFNRGNNLIYLQRYEAALTS
ncbi:hypothetical protein NUACC26_054470 [Scytonema sp. NUACC26]